MNYSKESADNRRVWRRNIRHTNSQVLRDVLTGNLDSDDAVLLRYRGTEGWITH